MITRTDWAKPVAGGFSPAAESSRTARTRWYGSSCRAWTPAHLNGEAVSASYDAGVPTVRVAGACAGTQAQRIEISK